MRSLEQDYISGVFTPFAEATKEEVDETQKPPRKRVASSTGASGKKTKIGKRPQKKTKKQPGRIITISSESTWCMCVCIDMGVTTQLLLYTYMYSTCSEGPSKEQAAVTPLNSLNGVCVCVCVCVCGYGCDYTLILYTDSTVSVNKKLTLRTTLPSQRNTLFR